MKNLFGGLIELKRKKKKAFTFCTNTVFQVQSLHAVTVTQELSYYARPVVVLLQHPASGSG